MSRAGILCVVLGKTNRLGDVRRIRLQRFVEVKR